MVKVYTSEQKVFGYEVRVLVRPIEDNAFVVWVWCPELPNVIGKSIGLERDPSFDGERRAIEILRQQLRFAVDSDTSQPGYDWASGAKAILTAKIFEEKE